MSFQNDCPDRFGAVQPTVLQWASQRIPANDLSPCGLASWQDLSVLELQNLPEPLVETTGRSIVLAVDCHQPQELWIPPKPASQKSHMKPAGTEKAMEGQRRWTGRQRQLDSLPEQPVPCCFFPLKQPEVRRYVPQPSVVQLIQRLPKGCQMGVGLVGLDCCTMNLAARPSECLEGLAPEGPASPAWLLISAQSGYLDDVQVHS